MPRGDPGGYLPGVNSKRVEASRGGFGKAGGGKFGKGKGKSKRHGKSAPIQKSLRGGHR